MILKCFFILFVFISSSFGWSEFFSNEDYVFSNYPESISSPGLVFDHQFDKNKFRVFYHHKNIMNEHMDIVFLLSNLSDDPAVINIQKGLGGSSEDVVFAGHKALSDFFNDILTDGDLMSIPPKSTVPVLVHKIKSQQVSSGIVRFESFSDANLRVKMMVVDDQYSNITGFSDVPTLFSQFRVSYYEESIRYINEDFNLNDPYASFQIGGKPFLKDKQSPFKLKGNYGLVYSVEVVLNNNEDRFKHVEFFLAPTKKNGVDRGVFLIDGEVVEVGILNYKEKVVMMERFHQIKVPPNQSMKVFMVTMPQAGCFYPVDIILKSKDV